jgi:general nucleoside transport system ATP-binding protein
LLKTPLIEFSNVSKKYGALAANDDLSLAIARGSIHAIIGENGAGKTTAMRLLFGLETPTSGKINFNGAPKLWTSPRGAMASGLGMVHQHFMLSPVHSALDNVILGRENGLSTSLLLWRRLFAPIRRTQLRRELKTLAESVGFDIPWDHLVETLSVGTQQQLEIVKLLHAGVEVMIFDEPTAVLAPDETQKFLDMLLRLNKLGRTIIVITHKLKEVKAIAHHVSVLRRGKLVASVTAGEVTEQDLADLMVGRHVHLGELPRAKLALGGSLVSIKGVTIGRPGGKNILHNLSIDIPAGRIIGIAGVEGSGQNELLKFIRAPRAILKGSQSKVGTIEIFGQNAVDWSNRRVRRESIGIVPADRIREAVLPAESLLENDLLGHDHEFATGRWLGRLWLDRTKARARLIKALETFDVRPLDPDARLGRLSGGNQQKFVMARELSRNPKLILVAQPTRGVDVGSIEQIHRELLHRRDEGAGILLVSSQLEELMTLSDVIHVLFEGTITATLQRSEFHEGTIGIAMGGGTK